jgi:hypothetical protein
MRRENVSAEDPNSRHTRRSDSPARSTQGHTLDRAHLQFQCEYDFTADRKGTIVTMRMQLHPTVKSIVAKRKG